MPPPPTAKETEAPHGTSVVQGHAVRVGDGEAGPAGRPPRNAGGGRDEHLRFTGGGSEGQREGARSRSHCGSEGLAFCIPVSTRHWPWAAPGTEWQNPPTGWQSPLAEGHVSGDRKSRAPLAAARSSGVGARGEGDVAGVPAIPALPAVCWALFALAELAYSTESPRQVPNVPDL